MEKSKLFTFLFISAIVFLCASCKHEDSEKNPDKIQVRYIEQICCGNMMATDNFQIQSECELYQDSLLRAINIDAFEIPQNYQFGDILSIEFKLTKHCEASCDIICNRYNGIPIEIIAIN